MAVPVQTRTKNRRVSARYATIGVLAVGLILAVAVGNAIRPGPATSALEPAPDFTTTLYSGGTGEFTLSQRRGYPVVLNFWGTWCPNCLAEFPALQRAADKYKEDGIVVFGVNAGGIVRDTEREAKEFLAQQGTTFFTGPDLDDQITIDYRVAPWFPTTYFITRKGEIYKKWSGPIDDKHLTEIIEELLSL